jgi:hypothetical protein
MNRAGGNVVMREGNISNAFFQNIRFLEWLTMKKFIRKVKAQIAAAGSGHEQQNPSTVKL